MHAKNTQTTVFEMTMPLSGVLPREFITLGANPEAGIISVTSIIEKNLIFPGQILFVTSKNVKFDNLNTTLVMLELDHILY